MNQCINLTIGQQLKNTAVQYPNKAGAIFPAESLRMTYKEIEEKSNIVAKALIALGINKGAHIGIWGPNTSNWMLLLFGATKIGAVIVPLITSYKFKELQYIVNQSEIEFLFSMTQFRETDCELITKKFLNNKNEIDKSTYPSLKNVYYIDENPNHLFGDWNDFLNLASNVSDEELKDYASLIKPDDLYSIQYTSGTTSLPKGAMLTQFGALNTSKACADILHLNSTDICCVPLPFSHCFGNILTIMAGIILACPIVYIDNFTPLKVMNTIQNEKCTVVVGVPTMFIAMLNHPSFHEFDFTSLDTCGLGGSLCPVSIMEQISNAFQLENISIGYGLSETASLCTLTEITEAQYYKFHTVGKAIPGIQIKIVDPITLNEVPVNTQGELLVKGYNVMNGYYNKPEENQNAFTKDGWFRTGDIATVDENGFYKIVGRYKDIIIRGGENISPGEVEKTILTLDNVKDVQIIAVPDSTFVDEIAAFIITNDGNEMDASFIKEYVKTNLASYKRPKYIAFVSEFPTTESGKVQKFKLKEYAIELWNLNSDT
ncbi:AMP-binding protein [Anaerosacchariphilus polymeriproducens]|uniref:AMP-binding protein n=1 Tax=Anaerosacchariphilus polymeriproducens TaxID=1812858 RepID=A0A371AYY8_9FIRM|nr:AMP-binding protein [Anaerosacchariphilus polymeriproducens]RDU24777.1 AMP-binding protein [Anaerosacchariphilus polymeriproducens]